MAKRKFVMSDLVRTAMKKGISKTSEIIDSIQREHGVTVRPGLIHNLKSTEKKKSGAKRGPKPGRKPMAVASGASKGTVHLQDLTIVKGLLTRHGKDAVQEMVSVLS